MELRLACRSAAGRPGGERLLRWLFNNVCHLTPSFITIRVCFRNGSCIMPRWRPAYSQLVACRHRADSRLAPTGA